MSEANTRVDVLEFFVAALHKIYPLVPVRKAKQKQPTTNELNIVVDLLSERNLGNEVIFLPAKGQFSNAGIQQATLNVQAIGKGSVELMDQLQYYLEMPSMVELCYEANVAVNDVGEVQDLTMALDSDTWQERASVDLTISYSRELLEEAGWFDKVDIGGELSPGEDKPNPEPPSDNYVIAEIEIKGTLE